MSNPLPNGWCLAKLGDSCSKIGSGATPRGGSDVYIRHGTALIRSQNVYNQAFHYGGLAFVRPDHASELGNVEVEEHDVLLNITGDSVARCCLAPKDVLPARVNQHVVIIRPRGDILDRRFLRYFLVSPEMQARMLGMAGAGATRNALTKGMIEAFQAPCPPLNEQKAIAHILGTLDDMIELNRRMNETLEQIARAIFKSWFVDFDPVRAKIEGRKPPGLDPQTAALFPNSFTDSPLGPIPKGWKVSTIRDLTSSIQYGLTQSASLEPVGPLFLRITDIQGGRVNWKSVPYCRVSPEEHERYRLRPGDVLVARTGASTGENIYLPTVPDAVFASYLVRFQFVVPALARLVGAFMRTQSYFDYVGNCIGGSAQPNASAQLLAGAEFVVPLQEIAGRFAEIVSPLDKRMVANNAESNTLAAIRDALLPRLLSGEIRISDAARLVENSK